MKKLLGLLIVFLLLVGCGGSGGSNSASVESSVVPIPGEASSAPASSQTEIASSASISQPPSSETTALAGDTETFTHEFLGTTFTITLPVGLYPSGDGIMQDEQVVPENVTYSVDFPVTKVCWLHPGDGYVKTDENTYEMVMYEGEPPVIFTRSDSMEIGTFYEWGDYDVLCLDGAVDSFSPPKLTFLNREHNFVFNFFYTGTVQDARAYYEPIMQTVTFP